MRLDDLCEAIAAQALPAADAREHPERDAVLAARTAVADAVADDEFLLDCMSRELDLIEQRVPRQDLVPFFAMADSGITFAFRYWSPGSSAGPHEHTAWTITAVCRNALTIKTYDRESSYRTQTLVPKNLFAAPAGATGFVYDPCIHDPRNPTTGWSLSLHVTSPRDGERTDHDTTLPALDLIGPTRRVTHGDARDGVHAAQVRHVISCQIAAFLAATPGAFAEQLLARCTSHGPVATRRHLDGGLASAPALPGLTFTRTHPDLTLSCRNHDRHVALGSETPEGWVEHVRMARIARHALAFCAATPTFGIDEIPGSLTGAERLAIVDSLEEAGLVWQEAG